MGHSPQPDCCWSEDIQRFRRRKSILFSFTWTRGIFLKLPHSALKKLINSNRTSFFWAVILRFRLVQHTFEFNENRYRILTAKHACKFIRCLSLRNSDTKNGRQRIRITFTVHYADCCGHTIDSPIICWHLNKIGCDKYTQCTKHIMLPLFFCTLSTFSLLCSLPKETPIISTPQKKKQKKKM